MHKGIVTRAYAKINWTLDILGKREDGYHELDTLMQTVTLFDSISLKPSRELSLSVGDAPIPDGGDNLILRAARALNAYLKADYGAAITLEKRIPIAAGLGGGSADAAATLRGLIRLWRVSVPDEAVFDIALSIGADVPFCLKGGFARANGIGEMLQPLPHRLSGDITLIIIKPCRGVSTRDVFQAYRHDQTLPCHRPQTDKALLALSDGDDLRFLNSLGNVLQPVTVSLRPEVQTALDDLSAEGAITSRMSGSGPSVFGAFPTPAIANAAYSRLARRWTHIFVCKPRY